MKKREVNVVQYAVCEECGGIGHRTENCQAIAGVNQVYGDRRQYDMNSNTYHPGLRNHPNFRYGNASNQMNLNFQSGNQGGYSHQTHQRNYNNQGSNESGSNNQTGGDDLSAKMDALLNVVKESNSDIKEMKKTNEIRDKSHEALAKQVGQLADEMAQIRGSMGKLPSDTTVNPKHQIEERYPPKDERSENFKQAKISLPLLDDIKKVLTHVECLKELSIEKRHNKLPEPVDLISHVSAVLSSALPQKAQDPGDPLIPIQIGTFKIERALLDLGACVSILPGSLYDQYDFGPLKKFDTPVVLAN
ncbi:uncharacterized protein LOC110931746 [Helianthus annuus]|uniref:uncharacterized protein LOC110931746 n=1 Tax=Helianthus annuus TaxID=4232 RepID=UPI000B8F0739|nr:uncharacterized protein LOC110931746 [Helianthus annuus]